MNQIQEEVNDFFDYEPEVFGVVGTFGKALLFQGQDEPIEIGIPELAEYFANQAPNLLSGMRTLGGLVGDWRSIDAVAQTIHNFYKTYYPARYRNYINKHYKGIMVPKW